MSDIHIHRDHQLGLARARELAAVWIAGAKSKFGLDCTTTAGETADTVALSRSGLQGTLVVAADHFALDAKLGMMLSGFRSTIESEIQKNFDALLAAHHAP